MVAKDGDGITIINIAVHGFLPLIVIEHGHVAIEIQCKESIGVLKGQVLDGFQLGRPYGVPAGQAFQVV